MSARTSRSLKDRAVLVTGAGGRLGAELVSVLIERGAQVTGVGRADFDLGGREGVLEAIEQARPAMIFHVAAWTAVDACEDDPDVAYRINALGTRNVCEAATIAGARVIHVSTDHVFSGDKKEPYDEFDDPDPRSVYGRSKMWGERFVMRLGPGHVVVRSSRLFGGAARNYVSAAIEKARSLPKGHSFSAVTDQVAVPTYAPELALRLCDLAERGGGGIYHLTSQGPPCSWFELARLAFRAAGLDVPVHGIASRDSPRLASRPHNGVLANRVATMEGLEPLEDWRKSLEVYARALVADPKECVKRSRDVSPRPRSVPGDAPHGSG